MIKFCKDQWNANRERLEEALRGDTQLNNCDYKYCPFHGVDREIPAYFCEDYEPAEEGE